MRKSLLSILTGLTCLSLFSQKTKFDTGWQFRVDTSNDLIDHDIWTKTSVPVMLPHDWSIDLPFDKDSPSGNRGASLRGGVGVYTKHFKLDNSDRDKNIFVIFDGVYMNSTVRINGHTLGNRPFGYITFEYDLTPFLKFDGQDNLLEVRAENKQPNSRWYSGSGIYRDVWIDKRGPMYVTNWGTYITTPKITKSEAEVKLLTDVATTNYKDGAVLKTTIYSPQGQVVKTLQNDLPKYMGTQTIANSFTLNQPQLWDTDHPNLYKAVSKVVAGNGEVLNTKETKFGIRSFHFDKQKGFFLNGKHVKIIGANMHHDVGALGAAFNRSAVARQFKMLKEAGFNGLRGSHNPPDPQWLDLADEMGFLVMDEAFDVWTWNKENTPFNYQLYFKDWHYKDLSDMIKRDRNHPSVILWSIGNEIPEQEGGKTDTIGRVISRDLANIVRKFDLTRPITSGMNDASNENNIYKSGALDIIGINYHHTQWKDLGTKLFPSSKPYIITEATSALATRGHYDMPSSQILRQAGLKPGEGNKDFTMSSYENRSAPWSSTNEEALKLFLKYPYLSGMYIWTGFDYLGEPTPYPFPARSSYFGIIDMAGFPKDSYYLYKSIFSKDTVLHIVPMSWNWTKGQKIDVHVYFNNADTVALYLNGKLLGKKSKEGDDLFVRFNGLTYEPGTLKAVSTLKGKEVKTAMMKTAGKPYKLVAEADQSTIAAGGVDLSFVKISVLDKSGNFVPTADNTINFSIDGPGTIAASDNGYEADLEPFSNKKWRNAYNGLALAIIRPDMTQTGTITLKMTSPGLKDATVTIKVVQEPEK